MRVLAAHGFEVTNTDIAVLAGLDEVHNFSWDPLLRSLVSGGTAKFGDVTYEIDPKLTNPVGLSVGKYFNTDAAHKLPSALRSQLPPGYLAHVDAMESFSSVVCRFLVELSQVGKAYAGTAIHVVMTGHDASAGFPAEVFSGGKLTGIQPGESIDIMFEGSEAFVTRVGALTDGDHTKDLFTEYHEFF